MGRGAVPPRGRGWREALVLTFPEEILKVSRRKFLKVKWGGFCVAGARQVSSRVPRVGSWSTLILHSRLPAWPYNTPEFPPSVGEVAAGQGRAARGSSGDLWLCWELLVRRERAEPRQRASVVAAGLRACSCCAGCAEQRGKGLWSSCTTRRAGRGGACTGSRKVGKKVLKSPAGKKGKARERN